MLIVSTQSDGISVFALFESTIVGINRFKKAPMSAHGRNQLQSGAAKLSSRQSLNVVLVTKELRVNDLLF